ncbi:MAG: hypothetical protein KJO91_03280 [Gammaproteobacteria bacterium]|nr:hypothetical protein [Gammaproteobacteria bacterium]
MSDQDHSFAIEVTAAAIAERRELLDRRLHSWRTLTYCGFEGRGRRRHARRNEYNCYLDWYDPKLVFTGIAVLVMSCLDALFTLMLLDRGAYEANYFMARLMEISIEFFIAVKLAVTAFGIIFLLMHAHFQIWRIASGKRLLQAAVTMYGLLIGYELILLAVTNG